jgi:hypothetical protein
MHTQFGCMFRVERMLYTRFCCVDFHQLSTKKTSLLRTNDEQWTMAVCDYIAPVVPLSNFMDSDSATAYSMAMDNLHEDRGGFTNI